MVGDMLRVASTEGWKEYMKSIRKRVIFSAKEKKQNECASDSNDPSHQNKIFRIANHMVKERQDITGSNHLKAASGTVIVDEKEFMKGVHGKTYGIIVVVVVLVFCSYEQVLDINASWDHCSIEKDEKT